MSALPDAIQGRRRLLIEDWMPARAVGIECLREENFFGGRFPPLKVMHVWWARRPLAVSRAAVLLSLLPTDADRALVERILGLHGGSEAVVRAADALAHARQTGVSIPNPSGPRAFEAPVAPGDIAASLSLLSATWGEVPTVLDPMAGGGSIPLEATRLGLRSFGSDYNPVAATVMRATTDHPFRFGPKLAVRAKHWGAIWEQRIASRLRQFYSGDGNVANTLLFARTVPCPETGHPTPLVPVWSLLKPATVAVPVDIDSATGYWRTEIRQVGTLPGEIATAPERTYTRGGGRSLFGNRPVFDSGYVQGHAQSGRMGQVLYAVAVKDPRLRFRPPTDADLAALASAETELARLKPGWERDGILPVASIPDGDKTKEPLRAGANRWTDLFAPRQLLAMGILVEELRRLEPEIDRAEGEMATAIVTLLAFIVDKVGDYNSFMSTWEKTKQSIGHTFAGHDFSFKPRFTEMPLTVAGGGLSWAITNVISQSGRLAALPSAPHAQPATVAFGSATNLVDHEDGSITAVVVDPPYYDNVQYSELADYFYVWLSRTIGNREPTWFLTGLCPNGDEAVANTERQKASIERRDGHAARPAEAKAAAHAFYERLMLASFRECRRVLRPDGVMTVMFTHTRQEAWVALATAIRDAGFTVTATWPVATESTSSVHIRGVNAAQSTVLLVARPRPTGVGTGYWEGLRPRVLQKARETAARLEGEGITGVDQLVGSFGPAIGVASEFDDVRDVTGRTIGFETVIATAAEGVGAWRAEQLVASASRSAGGAAAFAGIDALSRAVLVWWGTFRRGSVGFDEALLLTRGLGMDVQALVDAGLVAKDGGAIVIRSASERRRDSPVDAGIDGGGRVHPQDRTYGTAIDACHALALAGLEGMATVALAPGAMAPGATEAGRGMASAIWQRLPGSQRTQAGALLSALVAGAPVAARHGAGVSAYPEFGVWRSLHAHLGLGEPPEWKAPSQPSPRLPGFGP